MARAAAQLRPAIDNPVATSEQFDQLHSRRLSCRVYAASALALISLWCAGVWERWGQGSADCSQDRGGRRWTAQSHVWITEGGRDFFSCIWSEEKESESEASLLPFLHLCLSVFLRSPLICHRFISPPSSGFRCWHPVGDALQGETPAFPLLLCQFKPVFLSFWIILWDNTIKRTPAA